MTDAETHILHNAEGGFKEIVARDTAAIYDNNPQLRLVEEIFDFNRKLIGFRVYDGQSDAKPLAKHPLGPNGKPMTDWYYDNDGVCRPSLPAKFEIERLTERVNQLEKTVEALGRM